MSDSESSNKHTHVPSNKDSIPDKGSKPGGFGTGGSYDIPDPGTKPGGFGKGGSYDVPDPGTKPGGFGAGGGK